MKKLLSSALLVLLSLGAGAHPSIIEAPHVLTGSKVTHSLTKSEKPTVVLFLSAICPCSNGHVPELLELTRAHPDVKFVGIHSNADEAAADVTAYFKEKNLPFDVVKDEKAKLADEFRAYKTPHAFVFSKEGQLLYTGGVTDSSSAESAKVHHLKNALEALKHNQEIKVSKTRTLGCIISR